LKEKKEKTKTSNKKDDNFEKKCYNSSKKSKRGYGGMVDATDLLFYVHILFELFERNFENECFQNQRKKNALFRILNHLIFSSFVEQTQKNKRCRDFMKVIFFICFSKKDKEKVQKQSSCL
jgi:hypothetical protein